MKQIATVLVAMATTALCLPACTSYYPWRTVSSRVVHVDSRVINSQADRNSFAATVSAAGDGSLVVRVSGGCVNTVQQTEQVRIRQARSPKGSGRKGSLPRALGAGFTGVGVLYGGLGLFVIPDTIGTVFSIVGGIFVVVGLPLLIAGAAQKKRGWRSQYRTRTRYRPARTRTVAAACPGHLVGAAAPDRIQVQTPYGRTLYAPVQDGVARVRPNWSAAGIDPMSRDPGAFVRGNWTITAPGRVSRHTWRPSRRAVRRMVQAIAAATGVDTTVRRGGPPPVLQVLSLRAESPLVGGRTATIALTLRNTGSGDAYRVIVSTASSDPVLHGLRFAVGRVPAGGTTTRRIQVRIPRTHRGTTATIVFRFQEANGNVPDQQTARLTIASAKRPILRANCRAIQGVTISGNSVIADAGANVMVRCTIRNNGRSAATNTTVKMRLGYRGPWKSSMVRTLRPRQSANYDVMVRVPSTARTATRLRLNAVITESNFNTRMNAGLWIEIGSQRICTGTITRAEYNRKRAQLLSDLRNGIIDRKTFDKYDAQLVGCLR